MDFMFLTLGPRCCSLLNCPFALNFELVETEALIPIFVFFVEIEFDVFPDAEIGEAVLPFAVNDCEYLMAFRFQINFSRGDSAFHLSAATRVISEKLIEGKSFLTLRLAVLQKRM